MLSHTHAYLGKPAWISQNGLDECGRLKNWAAPSISREMVRWDDLSCWRLLHTHIISHMLHKTNKAPASLPHPKGTQLSSKHLFVRSKLGKSREGKSYKFLAALKNEVSSKFDKRMTSRHTNSRNAKLRANTIFQCHHLHKNPSGPDVAWCLHPWRLTAETPMIGGLYMFLLFREGIFRWTSR